jgi:hypothetical protein
MASTGDLGFQQFAFEQHLAEPGLQPLAFERLTISGAGGQARLASSQEGVTPGGQRRRGDAQRARRRFQVLGIHPAGAAFPA